MTQVLIPRPIAWVLSQNENQSFNLAPFSYFSGVCSNPPLISLSIGKRKNGEPKDTRRNILERQHFTLHLPSVHQAQLVTDSGKDYELGLSELQALNIETERLEGFSLPIIKGARIALACEYHQHFEIGEAEQALILGRVLKLYAAEEVIEIENEQFNFNSLAIDPLARLGGQNYAGLTAPFSVAPN